MKLFRFINKYISFYAGINKSTAIYTPKPNCEYLLLLYCNFPNYFWMMSNKFFRHAQTQHGNNFDDWENIILCKTNLFPQDKEQQLKENSEKNNKAKILARNDPKAFGTDQTVKAESPESVRFFEVKDDKIECAKSIVPFKDKEKPQIENPEKRKAEDFEELKDLKKPRLETKTKLRGYTEERYHETSYYMENGLRKVYPYYFTYTTFAKGRWVGENVLDVFVREFRAHPGKDYERAIKTGSLTVNNEIVAFDYKLKNNDLLAHTVHRHENAVTCQPIKIVHMDDDILVVNKPSSIPVHPCGRYRHNTVIFILAKEYNLKNLHTIHRLDRLTSGLLLFGRTTKQAKQIQQQILKREVQKEYICRVEGDFPDESIECNEPIGVISHQIGVCKVSAKGKDSKTTFQKISCNGKTSVVLCKPLTGRMHQIRVHLQYLGFPIVNDPLYNSEEAFGPLKGRGGNVGGKTDEELINDLNKIYVTENCMHIDEAVDISEFKTIEKDCDIEVINLSSETTKENILSQDNSSTCANTSCLADAIAINKLTTNEDTASISSEVEERNDSHSQSKVNVTVATQTCHEAPDMAFNPKKFTSAEHCHGCKVRWRDPKPKDLVMYLHAWKYKGLGWEYETELPNWGSADWMETD